MLREGESKHQLTYQGIVVSATDLGKGMENYLVRVFHLAPNKDRLEYLADGKIVKIVVENGHEFWDYQIGSKKIVKKSFLGEKSEIHKQFNLLKENYVFTAVGNERIANRETKIFTVIRKGSSKLERKVWLDIQTGLSLKIESYHPSGTLGDITYFKQINYRKTLPLRLFTFTAPCGVKTYYPGRGGIISEINKVKGKVNFPVIFPAYLPKGYVFDSAAVNNYKGNFIVHLRYKDGVNTLSIFQSLNSIKLRTKKEKTKKVIVNKSRAYIGKEENLKVLSYRRGKISLLITGNLSEDNLIKIAESLK